MKRDNNNKELIIATLIKNLLIDDNPYKYMIQHFDNYIKYYYEKYYYYNSFITKNNDYNAYIISLLDININTCEISTIEDYWNILEKYINDYISSIEVKNNISSIEVKNNNYFYNLF